MVLPNFVVLKSQQNGKYLRYLRDDMKSLTFIQSSGDDVTSLFAKFKLVPAKTENSSGSKYVHVKCCYNNKYWSLRSEDLFWVVASSDKTVEDKSKWSCTLFEPVPVSDDKDVLVRLRHVHLGYYLSLDIFDRSHDPMLLAETQSRNGSDVYKIIDWDSFMILPRHVAFKGDNGKYLGARTYRKSLHFLEFSFTDIGNQATGHEVSIVGDGCIRIKSDYNGRYWYNSTNWVWAGSEGSDEYMDSKKNLFWPVKVGENTVALRHVDSNRFCKRLTDFWVDSLNVAVNTITNEAKLVVTELVVSRDIYNIEYHIKDARIYEEEMITVDTMTVTNRSDQVSDTAQLNFEYTDIISSTWTNQISGTFGVKVKFGAMIPIAVDGKVEISASVTEGIEWGKTIGTEKKHSTGHTVTVPYIYIHINYIKSNQKIQNVPISFSFFPIKTKVHAKFIYINFLQIFSKAIEFSALTNLEAQNNRFIKVSMVATRGKCHLPFSYSQRDTRTNGEKVYTQQDGGIYTAKNCFNYNIDIHEEPLRYGELLKQDNNWFGSFSS